MASTLRVAGVCLLIGCVASCDRSESPVAPAPLHDVAGDSASGRIAFVSYRDGNNEIYVMNADGSGVTRLTNDPAIDQDPAWSPDGSRLAFTSTRDGNYEIYVMDADGSNVTRLTNDPNRDLRPAWCGTRIAFQSDRYLPPFYDVYVMNDDGTEATRLTIANAPSEEAPSWSPSCDRIVYSYEPQGTTAEIYVMNADGSGNAMLGSGVGRNRYPAWSPDGTRIAFSSDRDQSDVDEIYVMNADGTQPTRLTVRTDYHHFVLPAWSSDGTRIVFQANAIASPGTYVINPDGSGLAQIADGVASNRPAWFGPAGPPPPPNELPVPSFTTSCDGFACSFTDTSSDPDGTIVAYQWTFGDFSQASVTRDASHTYARGGTYNVTLVVTDDHGATNTTNQIVTVVNTGPNQPPVASIKVICTHLDCTFSSTSTDADSWITAYSWTFGDGTTSTAASTAHAYAAAGSYTVTLTVTDDHGATDSTTQNVTVTANQPPVASFTASCTEATCSFTSTSSDADGTIKDYFWNFGDGGTSTLRNPPHTYARSDTFTVWLLVHDNENASNATSQDVIVTSPNQPPEASFTSDCAELACSFTSTSSDADGSIVSYSWTFGDGSGTSTLMNPSHTYAAAGTYTVGLIVTDNEGAMTSAFQRVTVTAPPPPPPPPSPAHVGDLDGSTSSAGTSWSAAVVVTVVDAEGRPVSDATVTGEWSRGGSSSCTTDATGTCTVDVGGQRNRFHAVRFTVTGVTAADRGYDSAANADPDGDSDGTAITVRRQ